MYFYVDESGHTGLELFDPSQPNFYYGLLISSADLNIELQSDIQNLRDKFGMERLHANELTNIQKEEFIEVLIKTHDNLSLDFHVAMVNKYDHSIFAFFDQIFDSGVNDAVAHEDYWTQKRYYLLYALHQLFDDELAKQVWEARVKDSEPKGNETITKICRLLAKKAEKKGDVINSCLIQPLLWAADNISQIRYRTTKKFHSLQMSPNAIGFQFVLMLISDTNKLRGVDLNKAFIIVDQQSQFNKHQQFLFDLYEKSKSIFSISETGPVERNIGYLPITQPMFKSGISDVGLDVVDFLLWIAKRLFEKKKVPNILEQYYKKYCDNRVNAISMDSVISTYLLPE